VSITYKLGAAAGSWILLHIHITFSFYLPLFQDECLLPRVALMAKR